MNAMELYTLLPIILFAGLALYAVALLWKVMRDVLTRSWSRCTGKIMTYDVKLRGGFSSPGSYEVIVLNRLKYTYSVGGRTYENHMVSWVFSQSMLREIIEGCYTEVFSKAPGVDVYYNPKKPSQAVLLKGLRGYHAVIALPAVFLCIFVLWVVYSIH